MSTQTDREPCRLCGRQPRLFSCLTWACNHGVDTPGEPTAFGPSHDPSGTGWDAHMREWDAAYAAREKKGERVMTAPICPVCGREMQLTNTTKAQWMCFHGDNLEAFGCYFGPGNDSSGDLTRAQIAAMEQRIRDAHPHTDADGAPGRAASVASTRTINQFMTVEANGASNSTMPRRARLA